MRPENRGQLSRFEPVANEAPPMRLRSRSSPFDVHGATSEPSPTQLDVEVPFELPIPPRI